MRLIASRIRVRDIPFLSCLNVMVCIVGVSPSRVRELKEIKDR